MAGQLDQPTLESPELASHSPPYLVDNTRVSVPQSRWLCKICRSIGLQSHIERPWTVLAVISTEGHHLATIEGRSINYLCSLCSQFNTLFNHPALLPHLGSGRSFELWCRHVGKQSWITTLLFIRCHNANESIALYPTNASVFRSLENGKMLPPIAPPPTDPGRHLGTRTVFACVVDSICPDFDMVER